MGSDMCIRDISLAEVIKNYFNDSYKSAVSALVEEEKISVDDLRDIIQLIESKRTSGQDTIKDK